MIKYVKTIVYWLTLIGICVFVYVKREQFHILSSISSFYIVTLLLIGIISVTVNALVFQNNIKVFDFVLPFNKWYGLTVANTMYNYLLPARGGLVLRALYLKTYYQFPYTNYVSLTGGVYLINLFVSSLLALLISTFLWYSHQLDSLLFLNLSLFLFIGTLAVFLFLFYAKHLLFKTDITLISHIESAYHGLQKFKDKPVLVAIHIFLHVSFLLVISLRLYLVFYVLEIDVSYSKVVLVNSLVVFSLVFSITPGNIGVKEGIVGLSSGLLNITPEQAILGAVFDRVIDMVIIFSLGIPYNHYLIKKDMNNITG